jgi:predicted nucleic acid-binding protein
VSKHLFIETNWVVDYCAPAHFKVPEAVELLQKAQAGAFSLHLPSICISEARNVIRKRFDPVKQIASFRKYLKWAKTQGKVTPQDEEAVRRVLDIYQGTAEAEFSAIETSLKELLITSSLEVFALNEDMLLRSVSLSGEQLDLHPFDVSVLAAVLGRAAQLKQADSNAELFFCEKDSDLQPWSTGGNYKPALRQLYDAAHIWVYADYQMSSHERPDAWPR